MISIQTYDWWRRGQFLPSFVSFLLLRHKFCFILTILPLPFCEIGLILLDTKIKSSGGVKLGPFVSLLSFDTRCLGEGAVSKLLT